MDAANANEAGALFSRHAAAYDADRRKLIPPFDAFYGTAVEVATLRLPADRAPLIADLGAGTGLLTSLVAAARPDARFVLVDASSQMLDAARDRLAPITSQYDMIVGDFADALPDGPFDAVVSALAIHHLDDPGKRALFAAIHDRLRPGGAFVNAEQVAGPTPALDALYVERWMTHTTALGTTPDEHAAAADRMSLDLTAPTDAQCEWLRDAGFVDVDCFFKAWRFAVFGGWRAV
jgi:tRNA (cmo5U34)-methyltransferase